VTLYSVLEVFFTYGTLNLTFLHYITLKKGAEGIYVAVTSLIIVCICKGHRERAN